MIDKPAPSGQLVTAHTREPGGKLSAPLGTVEVVDPSVVILRGVTTLRLPIVVVAEPDAVGAAVAVGKPSPAVIDVVAIHASAKPTTPEDPAPVLALELAPGSLRCLSPAKARASVPSWWCLLFPNLPVCRTN